MHDAVIVILEPVFYSGYSVDVRLVFEAIEGKKNRKIETFIKLKEVRGASPIDPMMVLFVDDRIWVLSGLSGREITPAIRKPMCHITVPGNNRTWIRHGLRLRVYRRHIHTFTRSCLSSSVAVI